MSKTEEELSQYLRMRRSKGPSPVLWVGAGASAAAGYPTLAELDGKLRAHLAPTSATGWSLIDEYVAAYSKADLSNLLESEVGTPRPFQPLHRALARLAGGGWFASVLTTNYDELIERALEAEQVRFVPQILEANLVLGGRHELCLMKLHGGRGDWKQAVLSAASYRAYRDSYPILRAQLAVLLRQHPVVFVGCSMNDPRLLDWLRELGPNGRDDLFGGRVLITAAGWARLPDDARLLLDESRIKPLLVDDHAQVAGALVAVSRELAPPAAESLVFLIAAEEATWTVVGPMVDGPEARVPNPLRDGALVTALDELSVLARTPVVRERPTAPAVRAATLAAATKVGARLTDTLLSIDARAAVQRRMAQKDRGRARLSIRVTGRGVHADQALALPWELLMPWPGRFAVEGHDLDVEREAVVDGAPGLEPPVEPLTLAVSIAAPAGQTALRYELEAFRLHQALVPRGHRVAFADLGTLDDLVDVATRTNATAIHFSGHGLPGALLFEDDEGGGNRVEVEHLVTELNLALQDPTRAASRDQPHAPRPFPRLFFLASCFGASADTRLGPDSTTEERGAPSLTREDRRDVGIDVLLDRGPSTAAALHRAGFAQVIGYFGPVSDHLATQADIAFYGAVGRGESTLQAVALARRAMTRPFEVGGEHFEFPLAWAQLALYRRGEEHPLARGDVGPSLLAPKAWSRQMVQVSGLPALEFGFIGRRDLQHELRRRVRTGRRLLVLQGLGGIGKTALATMVVTTIVRGDVPPLILRCGELDVRGDFVDALRAQVEEYGGEKGLGLFDSEALRELWERVAQGAAAADRRPGDGSSPVDPVAHFDATCRELLARLARSKRSVVIYVDNAESLQVGPRVPAPTPEGELGAWHPEADRWWRVMEGLVADAPVVVSTRYGWVGLSAEAWVPVGPMPAADILRMIETFPSLSELAGELQADLARQIDGHPRTVERLAGLVQTERAALGLTVRATSVESQVAAALAKARTAITDDLLLGLLWDQIGEAARAHARALLILRRAAPLEVVIALGSSDTFRVLAASSLLTRFPMVMDAGEGIAWADRWGMHPIVRAFVQGQLGVDGTVPGDAAHRAAGVEYAAVASGRGATVSDVREVVYHLHAAGEGDRAWPFAQSLYLHAWNRASFREAIEVLEDSERAGVAGDNLATNLAAQVGIRAAAGDVGAAQVSRGQRALAAAVTDDRRQYVLYELAGLARQRGDLKMARDYLVRSLEIEVSLRGTDEHASLAASLHALAGVLRAQGDLPGARRELERSLAITRKVLGTEEHPDVAASLHELAGVLRAQGDLPGARRELERSLAIKRKVLGTEEHPDVAASLHELAGVLRAQGDLPGARRELERSLAITRKVLGTEEHPDVAASLHELAGVLRAQGDLPGARRELERSLAITRKVLGTEEHPSVAASLHELAGVLRAQGDLPGARRELERSLAITRKVLGTEEHPSVAASLHELAGVLRAQGDLPGARRELERSLAIKRKVLGTEEHPSVAASLHELAGVLHAQGDLPGARRELERSLAIKRKVLGTEEHPSVAASLHALAGVLRAQGDLPGARRELERSLAIKRKVLGTEEHPDVAASLHELAGVLRAQGDLPGARRELERSLAITRKVLGTEEHPSVAASLHELAGVLRAQGDLPGARRELERSLAIKRKVLGTEEHPSVAASLHELAGVLRAQGDLPGARRELERSLAITRKVLGTEEHPSVAASLHELAGVLRAQGDLPGARRDLERVVQIELQLYGTRDHYSTAITEIELAQLRFLAGDRASGREMAAHAHAVLRAALGDVHPMTQAASEMEEMLRAMDADSAP